MPTKLSKLSTILFLAVLTAPARAETIAKYSPYPIIPRERTENLECHMITSEGLGLDLTRICDDIPDLPLSDYVGSPLSTGVSSSSSGGGGGSGGRGSSGGRGGSCPTAESRASDGSRCGGRASSERSGGQ